MLEYVQLTIFRNKNVPLHKYVNETNVLFEIQFACSDIGRATQGKQNNLRDISKERFLPDWKQLYFALCFREAFQQRNL